VQLARHLGVHQSQVSRWATGKALPLEATLERIENYLSTDLHQSFGHSMPEYELYVSAPITGLADHEVHSHHDEVASIVATLEEHTNSLYWPGRDITEATDLLAADLATERNMTAMEHSTAFVLVQFSEIVRPSGALIELGIALGRRMKTTIIVGNWLKHPYMLENFGTVAANARILPAAHVYEVPTVEYARNMINKNGRELLGLM